ncbi:hypothetical protein ACMFMG_006175 [Clarireedia jacksonii]
MSFSWLRLCTVPLLLSSVLALDLPPYPGLRTNQSRPGVLEIAFNSTNSDINIWGEDTVAGLTDIVQRLQNDNETKVVLFTSDVPKYFIAHLDLLISPFDTTIASRGIELLYNMTNLPQITIAAVNGVARGGGNEFLVSLDMRFAAKPHTLLGQPEVGLGVVPGGGGTQYLSRLIGRGRAMEYILSSKDINAEDAERIGWINQAFDTEEEMYAHIDELISRIALYPLQALAFAKQSINAATRPPLNETLEDANRFLQMISAPAAQSLIAKVLKADGNESAGDVELYLGEYIPSFYN